MNSEHTRTTALTLLLAAGLALSACGDDDDGPVDPGAGEEELITDVTVAFTDSTGAAAGALTFSDPDGEGGDAPVIMGDSLAANATYAYSVTLLNSSVTPPEDITAEVREEDTEHQAFLVPTTADLDVQVAITDADGDGRPLGLTGELTTGAASSGTMRFVLKHELDKAAVDLSNFNLDDVDGSTDIDIAFPVNIVER